MRIRSWVKHSTTYAFEGVKVARELRDAICFAVRAIVQRVRAERRISEFQAAVLARDMATIASCVIDLAAVGFNPYDVYYLARQGDPELNEAFWNELVREAMRIHDEQSSALTASEREEPEDDMPDGPTEPTE